MVVAPADSKSWVQRITIDSRRRDIGLGGYPFVGRAEARPKAFDNRAAIMAGRDPLAGKRRSTLPTFRQAAHRTGDALSPGSRNRKHTVSRMQILERHAFAVIGDMSVDRIAREDVLQVLTPIWSCVPIRRGASVNGSAQRFGGHRRMVTSTATRRARGSRAPC